MTSYKAVATWHPRGARYWSYGLLFGALFITGIWHGTSSAFAVFGLLNGVAVAVNRAYADVLKAALGRSGVERYLENRVIQCLAILATFHYVCFCHLVFSSTIDFPAWDQLSDAIHHVLAIAAAITRPHSMASGIAAALIALTLFWGLWNAGSLGRVRSQVGDWVFRDASLMHAVLGAQILIVVFLFCFDWTLEQEPPRVVYMRF